MEMNPSHGGAFGMPVNALWSSSSVRVRAFQKLHRPLLVSQKKREKRANALFPLR
jgi:hypothetical protein